MGHTDLFLRKLSASDIEAIKSIARIKKYAAGERVFSEGDDADSFYVIDHGKVVVFYDHNGADKELCTLGDNDYFGEMAIYNQDKRCASVEVLEQSLLLSRCPKITSRSCLPCCPSSAFQQKLHNAAMRPLLRLEDEQHCCAISGSYLWTTP